ncbi:GNAT family N-acetyltransferase [Chloroflexota bacterium]
MNLNLQFLSENDLPVLYQTFMEAFADYVQDASHVTETNFTNRAIKNGVDYETSVGAFDQGKMVGFTAVAHDNFCGGYAAFDAFTGIIKPYRGQGLAKAMFEFVVPKLKANGVERFYLEVIQSNEPAVRAYQKAGFTITREFDAFEIHFENAHLDQVADKSVEIRTISKSDLAQVADFFDWQPSWENSLASIQRIPDKVLILGAHVQNKLVGFLVYYPLLKWILNLAVQKSYRRQKIGTTLLAHLKDQISGQVPTTKIINVEHTDKQMIEFLKTVGFEFFLNQYEMKLDL